MRVVECGLSGTPNAEAWDRLVAQDPCGHLLQTWAWGDLKAAYGWRPLRLAVEVDGSPVAGAQVLFRAVGPLSVAYIPKGPVLATEDSRVAEVLLDAVHRASRRRRALYLKVEPEWRDGEEAGHPWLAGGDLAPSAETVQPRRTIVVDLAGEEDRILARMKSKWRYNIRLAGRKGVEVRQAGAEGLATFYRLMEITGERDGFGIHTEDYYRRALGLFAPAGRATLLLAYVGDEPLAGLMPFAFNGVAWYMYGASSNARRELMPNHLLQWEAMRWARAQGCRLYDLWGIPDADKGAEEHDLGGVGRFKQGFGGEVVRYVGAYDRVYAALPLRLARAVWALRSGRALSG